MSDGVPVTALRSVKPCKRVCICICISTIHAFDQVTPNQKYKQYPCMITNANANENIVLFIISELSF